MQDNNNPKRLTKPGFVNNYENGNVIKDLTECKRCSEKEIVDSSRGD